jgi:hypothetical protein
MTCCSHHQPRLQCGLVVTGHRARHLGAAFCRLLSQSLEAERCGSFLSQRLGASVRACGERGRVVSVCYMCFARHLMTCCSHHQPTATCASESPKCFTATRRISVHGTVYLNDDGACAATQPS